MNTQQRVASTGHVIPPLPVQIAQPNRSGQTAGKAGLQDLLAQFEPIALAQMDAVALLDRTDTKYVLRASQLNTALAALANEYWVLDIASVRLHPYETLYFDTPDFAMYMRHHAGRPLRYKVRSRQYVESQRSFLEVKVKANAKRTSKKRVETAALMTRMSPELGPFVESVAPVTANSLAPKLWNTFSRVTLVNKHTPERLTLDVDLRFGNGLDSVVLPGVAVAEVKQESIDRNSEFIRLMRAMAIHPSSFSKYCVGVAMLYQEVKHNNFKPRLQLVEKLIREENHVYRTH